MKRITRRIRRISRTMHWSNANAKHDVRRISRGFKGHWSDANAKHDVRRISCP